MIDVEELLRSNTETEVLEFKEAKFNYDTNKLGKYFSALGNEANLAGKDRAYLLFGVKNDKTVVGTQLSDAEINNFKHEIANHTSPTMSFIDVGRFSIAGRMFFVALFRRLRRVCRLHGKTIFTVAKARAWVACILVKSSASETRRYLGTGASRL